jgi:glycosidase
LPEKRVADLDFAALRARKFTPSPEAWEDEVLYFLMLDRFSDERERPPFRPEDGGNAVRTEDDAAKWREAGARYVGGTLKGLASRIGYLERLGVTAIWISPIFKQVAFLETYHGYGVQDFLDVEPHFGTREDLKALVAAAHGAGIRVILDIILNHSGNVFSYRADRYEETDGAGRKFMDPRWDGRPYTVAGFNDERGAPTIPFGAVAPGTHANGAIWPAELQDGASFTQRGRIDNWDYDPEFREGDFFDLKDIRLGEGPLDEYRPSEALRALSEVYKFWIAFADLDGYRVDTVKHMDAGATRYFCSAIHEFAQGIGKERFYLIGEITGGRRRAFETLELTGLDAALGIDDIPDRIEDLVKGRRAPKDYFDLFRNSELVQKESHVWFRDKVATVYDDHDQVRKGGNKARFCADDAGKKLGLAVLALNAATMGIPCIYYGSEQGFDGAGGNDRFIREAMFGGDFGAFRSRGRHFFNEDHPIYREFAKVLKIRRDSIVIRRGRQYLREISGNGVDFGFPKPVGGAMRSVVAWSRIFDCREAVLAINTDPDRPRTAWVTVDAGIQSGRVLKCRYSTDAGQVGRELRPEDRNGKAIELTVPAAGFVVFE